MVSIVLVFRIYVGKMNDRIGTAAIRIDDDVEVTVLNIIAGYQVRIGIDAPQEIPVHREEVYLRVLEETV